MIAERELWACANQMHLQYGSDAPIAIAERIGALALDGDELGVATWKAIAASYTKLFLMKDPGTIRQ